MKNKRTGNNNDRGSRLRLRSSLDADADGVMESNHHRQQPPYIILLLGTTISL